VRLILRLMLGLFVVIVAGVLYTLLISADRLGALALLVTAAIIAHFGRLFHRHLESSQGTITAHEVQVEPGTLYGISLSGPKGRFPIKHFRSVRVERISTVDWTAQGGPHERVRLIGHGGVPNVLVARTDDEAGRLLGRELARLLGLAYEEERPPY